MYAHSTARRSQAVYFAPESRAAEPQTPASARLGQWLAGRPELTITSGAGVDPRVAFTRARGTDVSELDFVVANTVAMARLESCSTENGVAGVGRFPLAPLTASDHRAVRAAVRLEGVGATRAAPPRSRSAAGRDEIETYQSRLAAELEARVGATFAVDAHGFSGFGGSADRAAAGVVAAIAAAEDGAGDSTMVAPRRGGPSDRYASAATLRALAAADDVRRALDIARAHRQRALVDSAAGALGDDAHFAAAIGEFDLKARATAEHARTLRDAGVADSAYELYVGERHGASQSATQRLHAECRAAIDRAPKRAGSAFEFEVLATPDGGEDGGGGGDDEEDGGSRYLFDGAMRAFLAGLMAKMHALNPGDVRFCPSSLRALKLAHETYVCTAREAECAQSRRFAHDTRRWAAFDARARRGKRPSDAEWRARCAADMTVAEVKRAIGAMSTGTAASPCDGVQPAALKNGGGALNRVLATLFSRVLDTTRI